MAKLRHPAREGSPIYDPPAWIPPAHESPAYYSDAAAAPETVAEYAAPNELGGSAVYGGEQGVVAVMVVVAGQQRMLRRTTGAARCTWGQAVALLQ